MQCRGFIHVAFLSVFASIPIHLAAQENEQAKSKQVSEFVDQAEDLLGFSGCVLVASHGEVVFAEGRGDCDVDSDEPISINTLFEIASCTKTFTAIAIMQLQQSGKLHLDDSIAKHLEGVPDNCISITVRDLVAHTSGIPGTNTQGDAEDFTEALQQFLSGGPRHKPGTRFEYWNQGYSILSELIAQVSGMPYTAYVRTHIFEPAKMTASRFTGDGRPAGQSIAVGRSDDQASRSALEHPYGSYGHQYRGMGGLVSSIEDLWKWDRALSKHQLVNKDSFSKMITPSRVHRGLGWRLRDAVNGSVCHGHSGSVRGFLANINRFQSIDGAVFVLMNSNDRSTMGFASGLEHILLDRQHILLPDAPKASDVACYVGLYRDARGRRLEIKSGHGRLPKLTIDWGGPKTVGYLGLDQGGKLQLFMGGSMKADTPMVFDVLGQKAVTAKLIGKVNLSFRRAKD